MAGFQAISGVGEGLARHLRRSYELSGPGGVSCDFQTVGTAAFRDLRDDSAICALTLYRVVHNEHTRNQSALRRPLPLDLHLLFSIWLDSALAEQLVLGWLLRELARWPLLDSGMLPASGGFAPTDRLQFVPAELSLDDTSRLWQMLNAPYRPSVTYIVRNVTIGPEAGPEPAPVVATRFEYRDDVAAAAEAAP